MDKSTFIHHAITDSQSTIRSLDVKIGFLFLVILAPTAKAPEIISWSSNVVENESVLLRLFFIATIIAWCVAVIYTFVALLAKKKLTQNVSSGAAKGVYYDIGSLAKCSCSKQIDAIHSSLDDIDVPLELTYELVKVQEIRKNKMLNFNRALWASFIAMALAFASFTTHIIGAFYA